MLWLLVLSLAQQYVYAQDAIKEAIAKGSIEEVQVLIKDGLDVNW